MKNWSQPCTKHVSDTPLFKHFADDTDDLALKNNGGVSNQYDVTRWRRYLALWRSILYVELRTRSANTFKDFPANLSINRLIFAMKIRCVSVSASDLLR